MEVYVASHASGIHQAVEEWLEDSIEAVTPHKKLEPESWSENRFLAHTVKDIRLCEIEGVPY